MKREMRVRYEVRTTLLAFLGFRGPGAKARSGAERLASRVA